MRTMLTFLLGIFALWDYVGAATITSGLPSGDVVFAKVEPGTLLLTVSWSNNFTAVAELADDQKDDCIFPGRFIKDDESEVLVTGCSPDDDLSVQFQSYKFGDYLFTIKKDGNITHVEPDEAFGHGDEYEELAFLSDYAPEVSVGKNGRVRRADDYDYDYDGDEFVFVSEDLSLLPELDDYEVDDIDTPAEVELQINLYLDPDFRKLHGSRAESIARQAVGQAGLLMKHNTLDTKIKLVIAKIHNSNLHIAFSSRSVATGDFYNRIPKLLKSPFVIRQHPVAHVYLTKADGRFTKGVALASSMCNPQTSKDKPRAIVAWNRDVPTTAVTMSHELGHVLGMNHDFSSHSDRTNSKCAVKGKGGSILNYGNSPRRTFWSVCSNEDFKAYYSRNIFGPDEKYCLKTTRESTRCSTSEFQCGPNGKCIPAFQKCDFIKRHCPNGEDEADCGGFDY